MGPWLLYGVLAVVLTLPLAGHLQTRMIGGAGDPLFTCWYLDHNIQRLLSGRWGQWADTNIFFPSPDTWAYSEPNTSTSLLALPFHLLTGGDLVTTYNLTLMACMVLNAVAMHVLVFDLTRRRAAAVLAALVFAFAPARFGHVEHLHMVASMWMPLTLFFARRFLRKPGWGRGLGVGACYVLNALASAFYLVLLNLILIVVLAFHLKGAGFTARLRGLLKLGVPLGLAAIVVWAAYRPFFRVRQELGFRRSMKECLLYAARPASYLAPADWQARNWIYNSRRSWVPKAGHRGALLVGVVPLLLLTGWGVAVLRGRAIARRGWPFLVLALVAVGLSFGPRFLGRTNPLFVLLYEHLPGVDGIRVVWRYGVGYVFAVAVLAGLGVTVLGRLGRWGRWVAVGMVPLYLLECVNTSVGLERVPDLRNPPPYVAALKKLPEQTALVEIPLDAASHNWTYVYYSVLHRRRLFNGYSSYFPPQFHRWYRPAEQLLTAEALDDFARMGLTHLVIHTDRLASAERQRILARAEEQTGRLILEQSGPGYRLYRLTTP